MARITPFSPPLAALALGLALGCASSGPEPTIQAQAQHADAQQIARLERQVEQLRRDLVEAEEALVLAESGLRRSYSRAEVVSAAAQAGVEVERVAARFPWHPYLLEDARSRLRTCERHLERGHLGAAMYFATRARSSAKNARDEAEVAAADPTARHISAPRVNLREAPSLDASILRTLLAGTPVFPEAESGDWLRIRTPLGHTGWVHTTLVR